MDKVTHTLRPVSEEEGQFLLPLVLSQWDREKTSQGAFVPVSVTHASHFPCIAQDGAVEFSVASAYQNQNPESYVRGFTRIGRIRLQQALAPSSSAPSSSSASSLPSEAPSGAKEGESSP